MHQEPLGKCEMLILLNLSINSADNHLDAISLPGSWHQKPEHSEQIQ